MHKDLQSLKFKDSNRTQIPAQDRKNKDITPLYNY